MLLVARSTLTCLVFCAVDSVQEWVGKYGHTFELRLPSENQIWTTEPEHVKAMLATQFQNFEKGHGFIQQMHSFLGTGVFNSDGKENLFDIYHALRLTRCFPR